MAKVQLPNFLNHISLSAKGTLDNVSGNFKWSDALIDSAIIAAGTFFVGLAALTGAGSLNIDGMVTLLASTGTEFVGFLAIKRGLTKPITTETSKEGT
jgi:hypothetical protein